MKPRRHDERLAAALVCLECGDESEEGVGWRAYRDDSGELLVYCADCAAREFDA